VMVFLSATTNLGYLMVNNFNAVAFFFLVGIIMVNFSKNMAIVLTVCLVATNFLMATKIREGMTNADSSSKKPSKNTASDEEVATDETSASSSENAQKIAKMKKLKEKKSESTGESDDSEVVDIEENDEKQPPFNSSDEVINMPLQPTDEASGFRPMNSRESKKPQLDYGASITNAYKDLNSYLDPDALKSLTSETMTLMKEQKKLYESMNSMGPLLNQAKTLLDGFDMKQLNGFASMAKNFEEKRN
jgi:hypothetical protein